MAGWIETFTEFDLEIEHRPGLLHSNVDGMSRPFCKQYFGKEPRADWVNELEKADELTEPLGARSATVMSQTSCEAIRHVFVLPEISDDEMKDLQAEDPDLGPVDEWMHDGRCPSNEYLKSKSKDTRKLWA